MIYLLPKQQPFYCPEYNRYQNTYPPEYPQFGSKTLRMASYGLWQKSSTNSAEEMCDAGFFYTEKNDRQLCFVYGGGLCDWEGNDGQWTEYSCWFPRDVNFCSISTKTMTDSCASFMAEDSATGKGTTGNGRNIHVGSPDM
ncbi:hypothetical protein PR048_018732 [Dryococelus australis]|uniref:Uncharacterized protein n=1 Tax=Dryococelus australis TaxID=614101 RepID=A0ABQ9HDA5_9NEOP|nr:hypothetical protein PR048_018732 [Dryococelus australis]